MTPLRILLDPRRNTLELRLAVGEERPSTWDPAAATIDIGEGGQLIGVETAIDAGTVPPAGDYDPATGTLYVTLFPGEHPNARSAAATVRAGFDRDGSLLAIEIPRHGAGYEISYPSGNQ